MLKACATDCNPNPNPNPNHQFCPNAEGVWRNDPGYNVTLMAQVSKDEGRTWSMVRCASLSSSQHPLASKDEGRTWSMVRCASLSSSQHPLVSKDEGCTWSMVLKGRLRPLTLNSVTVMMTSHNTAMNHAAILKAAPIHGKIDNGDYEMIVDVRCAFSDRKLHSRMPLDRTHV
jgi:hypothetical protein